MRNLTLFDAKKVISSSLKISVRGLMNLTEKNDALLSREKERARKKKLFVTPCFSMEDNRRRWIPKSYHKGY